MIEFKLSTAGVAVLLASFGVGCGSGEGARPGDGGTSADGKGSADGQSSADGNLTSDGTAIDEGGTTDGGSTIDGGLSPQAVNLGSAGDYVILAMSGISTVPTSVVTGNLGISPAQATAITGFSLTMDSSGVFSTSAQVTGQVFAPGYAQPTPSNLTTAVGDMQSAFTDAAGRAPGVTELGAGNIGGKTLTAGVYKWSTGLLVPTNVTLTGSATDVWIFQVAQDLTVSNGTEILLAGGADPKNVFWQVAGDADLGTTVHFEGVILDMNAITVGTGARVDGRLLAQKAVNIESCTVAQPAP
jgi:hypothetical protein